MEFYENQDAAQQPQERTMPVTEHIQFEVAQEPAPEPVRPPKRKKKRVLGKILGGAVALLAVAAISCSVTAGMYALRLTAQEKRTEQTLVQLQQQIKDLQEELSDKSFTGNGNSISGTENTTPDGSMTPGQLYAGAVRSVVAITNEIVIHNGGQVATGTSSGSGFILTEDGYIVTNYHVVEGATNLTVTTYDGTNYPAQLRGYDSTNDLAVLKIDAARLEPVVIGSSDDLIVGDRVAVIGNPLGDLTATLTVGYVSAKDRVISTDGSLINMLQTDAAVNPGNSGGPIFNMNGEVVGIITAKYSGLTNSGATIEGIGFAIPVDDVAKKIADLVQYGYVTGGYLGVLVHDVDRETAEYYGLPYGVYVTGVTDGYCAKAAGVQARDIIIALGEDQITCMNDLTRALQKYQGGETTTVTVWRAGVETVLDITLDAKPQQ